MPIHVIPCDPLPAGASPSIGGNPPHHLPLLPHSSLPPLFYLLWLHTSLFPRATHLLHHFKHGFPPFCPPCCPLSPGRDPPCNPPNSPLLSPPLPSSGRSRGWQRKMQRKRRCDGARTGQTRTLSMGMMHCCRHCDNCAAASAARRAHMWWHGGTGSSRREEGSCNLVFTTAGANWCTLRGAPGSASGILSGTRQGDTKGWVKMVDYALQSRIAKPLQGEADTRSTPHIRRHTPHGRQRRQRAHQAHTMST